MGKLLSRLSIPLIVFVFLLILLASTGVPKHGQGFAQTEETATVNAQTGKVLCTELVTLNSQELLASATSDVDS
ncbi:hypothetical protein COP2_016619 [Malus domestica]